MTRSKTLAPYRPVGEVLVAEFAGGAQSAYRIAQALHPYGITAFLVPEGVEHHLRREDEKDPGNGNMYAERAKGFLALIQQGFDPVRVDARQFIVIREQELVGVYDRDALANEFEPVED